MIHPAGATDNIVRANPPGHGKSHGQTLIAPFPDLFPKFRHWNFLPKMPEGLLPRLQMKIVGVDRPSVEIENHGADHQGGCTMAASVLSSCGNCT
jgi:hypothetical protein